MNGPLSKFELGVLVEQSQQDCIQTPEKEMTEAEAHNLLLAYIEAGHGYGEAVWGQIQIWIGGSFAVILSAHFAPERMNAVHTFRSHVSQASAA